MRSKAILLLVFVAALAILLPASGVAFAQNVNVEWNRWDAQITVNSSNSNQMQIAETQEVHVLNGTLHYGTRTWDSPVQVQSVYLIGNDGNPIQLSQGNGYQVSQNGNQTTVQYNFPNAVNGGQTFTVQINYLATMPSSGIIDWRVVPGDHAFPVRSSTARIRLPSGQAPDSSLARVTSGNGTASVNGNEIVIQSSGTIQPQQQFGIQVPFGSGVGSANNNNNGSGNSQPVSPNNNGGVNTAPVGQPTDQGSGISLPGPGMLLLCVCGIGLLLLFGGGSLLRGLLGSFLGGGLGGLTRGGGINPGGGIFGGGNAGGPFNSGGSSGGGGGFGESSGGRGFRPSAGGQERELPNINNDKGSGGGASFG